MTNSKMNVSNRLAVLRKAGLALAILLGAGALMAGTASAADFHHGGHGGGSGGRGHGWGYHQPIVYPGYAYSGYAYPGYGYGYTYPGYGYTYPGYGYTYPGYGYAVAPPVYAPGLNVVIPLHIR